MEFQPSFFSPLHPNRDLDLSVLFSESWVYLFLQLQQVRPDQALKSQCSAAWVREVKNGWAHNHNHNHHNQNQQQIRNRGRNIGYERAMNLPHSVWRPQQIQQPQHTDTAMRAVLLGGSGVKRECSGTGVFLPRKYGNPPESRKKTGIAKCFSHTVFVFLKILVNLNFDFGIIHKKYVCQNFYLFNFLFFFFWVVFSTRLYDCSASSEGRSGSELEL